LEPEQFDTNYRSGAPSVRLGDRRNCSFSDSSRNAGRDAGAPGVVSTMAPVLRWMRAGTPALRETLPAGASGSFSPGIDRETKDGSDDADYDKGERMEDGDEGKRHVFIDAGGQHEGLFGNQVKTAD